MNPRCKHYVRHPQCHEVYHVQLVHRVVHLMPYHHVQVLYRHYLVLYLAAVIVDLVVVLIYRHDHRHVKTGKQTKTVSISYQYHHMMDSTMMLSSCSILRCLVPSFLFILSLKLSFLIFCIVASAIPTSVQLK
jgi:hypothetical protein